jgi:hypothetical protein
MFGVEVFMVSTSALVVPLGLSLLRGSLWMDVDAVFVVCVWFG